MGCAQSKGDKPFDSVETEKAEVRNGVVANAAKPSNPSRAPEYATVDSTLTASASAEATAEAAAVLRAAAPAATSAPPAGTKAAPAALAASEAAAAAVSGGYKNSTTASIASTGNGMFNDIEEARKGVGKEPSVETLEAASILESASKLQADLAKEHMHTSPSNPTSQRTAATRKLTAGTSSQTGEGSLQLALQKIQQASAPEAFLLNSQISLGTTRWEEKRSSFKTCPPEDLLADVSNLSYIGSGGYSSVFKANWHSATVALKLIASHWKDFEKSAGFYEALLGKELSHPNLVRCFETRCSQLTAEFVQEVCETRTPIRFDASSLEEACPEVENGEQSQGAPFQREDSFVSGDGFGSPAMNRTPASVAITWRDLLFCVGAKAEDYLTVVILEYCNWGCLSKAISKGVFVPSMGNSSEGRLRYRAMLRTAREMFQGLDHLHRLDVVHGDIKPANVLLKGSRSDRRGFSVQLIDYGLSRVVSGSNAMSGSAKGTLTYMAPEVFGGHLSKASDIFSAGIIMWEMLTGMTPYMGLQQGHIVLGVQHGTLRPPWPETLKVGVTTRQLRDLYQACVAQDPKRRPSAREAVVMLTRIENDLRAELKAEIRQGSFNGSMDSLVSSHNSDLAFTR